MYSKDGVCAWDNNEDRRPRRAERGGLHSQVSSEGVATWRRSFSRDSTFCLRILSTVGWCGKASNGAKTSGGAEVFTGSSATAAIVIVSGKWIGNPYMKEEMFFFSWADPLPGQMQSLACQYQHRALCGAQDCSSSRLKAPWVTGVCRLLFPYLWPTWVATDHLHLTSSQLCWPTVRLMAAAHYPPSQHPTPHSVIQALRYGILYPLLILEGHLWFFFFLDDFSFILSREKVWFLSAYLLISRWYSQEWECY